MHLTNNNTKSPCCGFIGIKWTWGIIVIARGKESLQNLNNLHSFSYLLLLPLRKTVFKQMMMIWSWKPFPWLSLPSCLLVYLPAWRLQLVSFQEEEFADLMESSSPQFHFYLSLWLFLLLLVLNGQLFICNHWSMHLPFRFFPLHHNF